MGEGGKSITAQHLKRAIDKEPKFDYLVGIVEKVPTVEVGGVGGRGWRVLVVQGPRSTGHHGPPRSGQAPDDGIGGTTAR